MKKITLLTIILIIASSTFAQWSKYARWKRYRYEVVVGIGTSSFMGDLGGGSNHDSWIDDYLGDFEFSSTRPSLYGAARYKLTPSVAMKLNIAVGWLSGDDKWSSDPSRLSRNLNFNSIIFEQSLVGEYSILKENNAKRWSQMRKKRVRAYSLNLYVFAGIGGFYFNPYGYIEDENGNKDYYNLPDAGTEGQNVTGDYYSKYAFCIPYGIGFKVGLSRKLDLGIEYGLRYAFTDYIDDVGGSYYDNLAIIESNNGDVNTGYLADQHIPKTDSGYFTEEDFQEGSKWEAYSEYYEVGDRKPIQGGTKVRSGDANDSYSFLFINLSYKLRTGRNGLPKLF